QAFELAGKEPGFVFPKQGDISVERIKQSKYFKALIQHSKGSKVVAKFCAKFLHQVLEQEEYSTGHIETSVHKSFLRIDEMMLGQRGWKELSALGGKINKFTGVIEGLICETSSDARSWFYGDDDSNERLQILSEYPDMFEASPARDESKIETQKLFPRPVRVIEKYPMAKGGDQGLGSI
ncbi:protein phosphatase 2C isoform X1, partial [Tanacetum coccineum]